MYVHILVQLLLQSQKGKFLSSFLSSLVSPIKLILCFGHVMIYYYGYSEASKIRFILQVAGESAAGENFGKFLQNIDFVKEKV